MKLDQNSFMENNSSEKFSPWTSYSDIFCSLMMVFVLLFSYAMIQYTLSDLQRTSENEAILQTSAELERQIDDLQLRLQAAEDDGTISSLKTELSDTKDELQIVILEKGELQALADSRNQQLIVLAAENADLQAQVDALSSDNEAQLIVLGEQNSMLEAQILVLTDSNEDLSVELASAKSEADELSAELEGASAEAERLQNMVVILQGNNDSMSVQISDLAAENESLSRENSDLRARIAAISVGDASQGTQDAVAGIRLEIITELRKALDDSGVEVRVDSETGAIMLNSEVLFAVNESTLKPKGKAFLNRFFPVYFETLAKGPSSEFIAQVSVEGHTDTTGSYLTNLDLSMRRAQSVLTYCLSMLDEADQAVFIRMFSASGCSYANPIYNSDGSVNMDKSRRVEIKFTLKDASMIDEIRRIVED